MAALFRGCSALLLRFPSVPSSTAWDVCSPTAGRAPHRSCGRLVTPLVWEWGELSRRWQGHALPWSRIVQARNRPRGRLIATAVAAEERRRYPQNEDFAPVLPKRKKKPYLNGDKPQRRKQKGRMMAILKKMAPNNGLLVKNLIPVAHDVMMARATVVEGVTRLLTVHSVKACRFCPEVHVGPIGHLIKDCQGIKASRRSGQHEWCAGEISDVIAPVESYHMLDRLGRPVSHDERFDVERIPAVVELCIQAGVELPGYPTVRRTQPVRSTERYRMFAPPPPEWTDEAIGQSPLRVLERSPPSGDEDAHWEEDDSGSDNSDEEDPEAMLSQVSQDSAEDDSHSIFLSWTEADNIEDEDDVRTIATKTLRAWEKMRRGCQRLMSRYRVRACGYCPEVQVGPRGHKARNCGAFKHQWRNGQHGWQAASLDELIPPKYVWHVVDMKNPLLTNHYRKFYGQTPAVVELCAQAGADIPDEYKPKLRLDVVIPDLEEMDLVV